MLVEKDGTYEITLRRWPVEADAAIAAGVPEFKAVDGGLPAGKALPIAQARLKIGEQFDETKPVGPDDKADHLHRPVEGRPASADANVVLERQGEPICGAYYAYVLRK